MVSSTVAKTDDGTIQITLSIPFALVTQEKQKALENAAKEVVIDGFRKGMAPIDQVEKKLGQQAVIEKTLAQILPQAVGQAIEKEKLALALYPRFELLSAKEGEAWQVRATSCVMPTVKLGDYQKELSGDQAVSQIWTPDKGKASEKKEPTQGEKEAAILKAILKTSQATIPQLLINQEVETRLASLLERLEKLGLQLEGYLTSVGKTPEGLRQEYETQVKESITLELALNQIADQEKITVSDDEIESAVKASQTANKATVNLSPEQKQMLKGVLRRQKILHQLSTGSKVQS